MRVDFTGYRSVYDNYDQDTWHTQSVVRASKRIEINAPFDAQAHQLFSPLVTEYATHAHVTELGPIAVARLRWGRLTDYLLRTERVEIEIVNRALTHLLARDDDLPPAIKNDLLKIYTDEAYHVLMMSEFGQGLSAAINFEMPRRDFHGLARIAREIDAAHDDSSLACVIAAIVTETLISGTLRRANDDSLYAPVRAVLSDHAHDESYHHAAFYRLGMCLLPRLTHSERQVVEHIVPIAIREFLIPDVDNIIMDLTEVGLMVGQIEEITEPMRDEASLTASLRASSVATRRLFEEAGFSLSI